MQRRRTDPMPMFRSVRVRRERGAAIALHAHDEAQLMYAASGAMQIHTEVGHWLVSPASAVWLPSWLPHRVDVMADADLLLLYWSPKAVAAWAPAGFAAHACAPEVSPLLRELLRTASSAQASGQRAELTVRLVLEELAAASDAATFLPLPTSDIGRRVSSLVMSDPGCLLSLADISSRAASSARSVSRLFPLETGLTFKAWRQRARILSSLDRLNAGASIQRVAHEVGYASSSAFATAFRQTTLKTPTAFQRDDRALPQGHDDGEPRCPARNYGRPGDVGPCPPDRCS